MKNPFKKKELKKTAIELKVMKAKRRTSYDEKYSKYFLEFPDSVVPFKGWQPYIFNDYEILPFEYLSNEQANNHFNLFIENFDNNIDKLKEIYKMYGYDESDLDYSEDSLVKLQKFIDENVDIIDIPNEEIEIEKSIKIEAHKSQSVPKGIAKESFESFQQYSLDSIARQEISLFWCCTLYYVDVYFSKILYRNKNRKWCIESDTENINFNEPVLKFEKMTGSFTGIGNKVVTQKYILKNNPNNSLISIYNYWNAM